VTAGAQGMVSQANKWSGGNERERGPRPRRCAEIVFFLPAFAEEAQGVGGGWGGWQLLSDPRAILFDSLTGLGSFFSSLNAARQEDERLVLMNRAMTTRQLDAPPVELQRAWGGRGVGARIIGDPNEHK